MRIKSSLYCLAVAWICILQLPSTFLYVNASATSNITTCQEDLDNMGVDPASYTIDNTSLNDPTTLFFAEVQNEDNSYSCYLYVYTPQAAGKYDRYDYSSIQISYVTSNEKSVLENQNLLATSTNYYNLYYQSESDNATVRKYFINGLDNVDRSIYRRYILRQLKIYYGPAHNSIAYTPLGDDFFYQTIGSETSYEWNKIEYLTLSNKIMYSYLISSVNDFFTDLFMLDKTGYEYWFYGFSPDKYHIDNLKEVSMIYQLSDYEGIKPYSNLFAPAYGALKTNTKTVTNTIVPEDVEAVHYKNFFTSYKYNWNRIAKQSEAVKNSNERFAKFMNNNFANTDWVVQFFETQYSTTSNSVECGRPTSSSESTGQTGQWGSGNEGVCYYLRQYDAVTEAYPGSSILDQYKGYYYNFTSKYIASAEVIRMKFETEGIVYDISVITSPTDSSGQTGHNNIPADKTFLDWLLEQFRKLAQWCADTLGLAFPLNYIAAVIIVIIGLVACMGLLYSLVAAIIAKGIGVILSLVIKIILLPFSLIRMLFRRRRE